MVVSKCWPFGPTSGFKTTRSNSSGFDLTMRLMRSANLVSHLPVRRTVKASFCCILNLTKLTCLGQLDYTWRIVTLQSHRSNSASNLLALQPQGLRQWRRVCWGHATSLHGRNTHNFEGIQPSGNATVVGSGGDSRILERSERNSLRCGVVLQVLSKS